MCTALNAWNSLGGGGCDVMERINEGDSCEFNYALGLLREASMNVQKREISASSVPKDGTVYVSDQHGD